MAVFHHQPGEGKQLGSDRDPEAYLEPLQARQTMVDMFGWKSLVSSLARGSRVIFDWVIPLAC
jgi:hypothetical protein